LTDPVFYLILLAGSLTFGLEALLIGLGGKLMVVYREKPWITIGLASGLGLWVVGISIVLGVLLTLEALHVCALTFLLTIAAGRTIVPLKPRLTKPTPPPPEPISDREIERDLRKRGLKPAGKRRK
jgi:hypothetical protein